MSPPITNKTGVPALRFSGFDESWDNLTMRDISSINQGLQIPIDQRLTEKADGAYFYITNEFLRMGSKKSYYIVDPSPSVTCVESDLLMTRTGNTGMVVTGVAGAFHNNFFKISYKESISRFFLYYFLTSHPTQHTLLKLAGASTIPDLNHGDFYRIAIAVPTLPEQRKIADFLTAVDGRIGQLIQKKALLTDYKKGVMQQLFTQTIRFKDDHGNDFPDWAEKKLGEVFEEIKERVGDKKRTPYSISAGKGLVSQKEKFGRVISGQQHVRYTCLKPSEFTYNKGASKKYRYGCVYPNPFDQEIAVPNVFISFRPIIPIATAFFAKLFEQHHLDRGLRRLISSSARLDGLLNLNKGDFFKIVIPYPAPGEQTKIANFLSAIDRKIKNLTTQITKTQTFKRGLLQQMFV